MKTRTTVKVNMMPVNRIMTRIGVDRNGSVQRRVTETVNRRMTRYMPMGKQKYLATKLKYIKSDTEIEVLGPYARYQYYGKKMVNAATGNGPAPIPGGGYRYRKGTVLRVTDIPLKQDWGNTEGGPFWDRRLMAEQGEDILAEIQDFVDRGEID